MGEKEIGNDGKVMSNTDDEEKGTRNRKEIGKENEKGIFVTYSYTKRNFDSKFS